METQQQLEQLLPRIGAIREEIDRLRLEEAGLLGQVQHLRARQALERRGDAEPRPTVKAMVAQAVQRAGTEVTAAQVVRGLIEESSIEVEHKVVSTMLGQLAAAGELQRVRRGVFVSTAADSANAGPRFVGSAAA